MYKHLKAEQDCFDEFGNCFIFMEAIASGAVVRQVFESYNGEGSHEGQPIIFTQALFAEEVSPKQSQAFAELEAERTKLREELTALQREIGKARQANDLIFGTLKNHEAVRDLAEFMSGGFKYLAHRDGCSWKIQPIEEAVSNGNECGRPSLRLLSLYGQSKGDLSWRLHQYSDGSGHGYSPAQPTKTLEDAQAFVKARLMLEVQEYAENFRKGEMLHMAEKLRDQMVSFGIYVPEHIEQLANAYAADQKAKTIERLEREIEQSQQKLAKAKGA